MEAAWSISVFIYFITTNCFTFVLKFTFLYLILDQILSIHLKQNIVNILLQNWYEWVLQSNIHLLLITLNKTWMKMTLHLPLCRAGHQFGLIPKRPGIKPDKRQWLPLSCLITAHFLLANVHVCLCSILASVFKTLPSAGHGLCRPVA